MSRCRVLLPRCRGQRLHLRPFSTSKPCPAAKDISNVFPSLSGVETPPLPSRFSDLKKKLIAGHEKSVEESWSQLLQDLHKDTQTIKAAGSSIIPEISFDDITRNDVGSIEKFRHELKERGAAVIRGVVSEDEALGWKELVKRYIHSNPVTGFPREDPAVFELYWSPSQLLARSHPNVLEVQKFLMSSIWHSDSPDALISSNHPTTYADRLRIRQPGDAGFALGPHMDGGSVERWEENGYGLGKIYDQIFQGNWKEYDPWESSRRIPIQSKLYDCPSGCSMYRMYQGWMSMSQAGPGDGHLKVYPLLAKSTAYVLLRPFFDAPGDIADPATTWSLNTTYPSTLQGAVPGAAQELSPHSHPHLRLDNCMTSIPAVRPGDYVAWHPDTIHAVDSIHAGQADSSVLYIPCCPLTESNAEYVRKQREQWFDGGLAGPDFFESETSSSSSPLKGEMAFKGALSVDAVMESLGPEGRKSMGLEKWSGGASLGTPGEQMMLDKANRILGFA